MHPENGLERIPSEASAAFLSNGIQFPPAAYEPSTVLHREPRLPRAAERAAIHGIPQCLLDGSQQQAQRCSMIGNSFHVPSLTLVISFILQVASVLECCLDARMS